MDLHSFVHTESGRRRSGKNEKKTDCVRSSNLACFSHFATPDQSLHKELAGLLLLTSETSEKASVTRCGWKVGHSK